MTDTILDELRWRLTDLVKQLDERARLYRLVGAADIADEFLRLKMVEVVPMIRLVDPAQADRDVVTR